MRGNSVWSKTDPRVFLQSKTDYWTGPDCDRLLHFGKFFFLDFSILDKVAPYWPPNAKVLVLERSSTKVPGAVLKRFFDANGDLSLVLYEVRLINRRGGTTSSPSP